MRAQRSSVLLPALLGAAVGAGFISLYGNGGRRRRALARDKVVHGLHQAQRAADLVARDTAHRVKGRAAELSHRLREHDVPDYTLVERARAQLGRVCSHPHAVHIEAMNGSLTLTGVVLRSEHNRIVRTLRGVRGVKHVDDLLEAYADNTDHPSLQGGDAHRQHLHRAEFLQENWAPSMRALASILGAGLMGWALYSRRYWAIGAGVLGGLLLGRGATNVPVKRLVGVGAGRRGLEVMKTMRINAPVDDVFAQLADLEQLPRFMSHVKEVRQLDEQHSHWIVEGPLGVNASWDAVTTRFEPNKLIAWKSIEGSRVDNAGMITFERDGEFGTRVTVRLSYNPPAGAVGAAFAKLFGRNPKKLLDDDLLRLKSLLETGKARGRRGQIAREDVH
jgi:uncharacterized membrane protein